MKNILLFEKYNENLELKNELQNHLSQYPFISYTLDDSDGLSISFNKDVNTSYGIGILNMFDYKIISKKPLKLKINKLKEIDKNAEYKGKVIIQNVEKISLPDLGIYDIEGKIDSGAALTSIGVSSLKVDRNKKQVSFRVLNESSSLYTGKLITRPLYSEITVQSSNGSTQVRPLIKGTIVIRNKEYQTYYSLSNRDDMDYLVLIGKDILGDNFLISPGL